VWVRIKARREPKRLPRTSYRARPGTGRVKVVVVPIDRADNAVRHPQVWEAVAAGLRRRAKPLTCAMGEFSL
jgi:hypothetical protein